MGSAMGNLLAGPTGGAIGAKAGSMLARITGVGDYKVESNSILQGTAQPTFQNTKDGMRVCHREYVADITPGSGSGVYATYANQYIKPINPANPYLFPYLAKIGWCFEQYRFHGLVFEYRPTSGTYAGTTNTAALGTVMMATQYNVADLPFSSKYQIDAYEYATSCVPFQSMLHPVECKNKSSNQELYYCWPNSEGTPNSGNRANAQQYDYGVITVATSGFPASYTCGELWVTYDVEFYKPRLTTSTISAELRHRSGSATATDRLGAASNIVRDVFGGSVSLPTTNTILLKGVGRYHLNIVWQGAAIAANPSLSVGSNISALNLLNSNSTSSFACFNAGGTQACLQYTFEVTAYGTGAANTITLAGLTSMTSSYVDLHLVGTTTFEVETAGNVVEPY